MENELYNRQINTRHEYNKIKNDMKIGTWNVRSFHKDGKLDDLIREVGENQIAIMGLSEVRWVGNGEFTKNGYKLYFSGGKQHHNGVGVLIDQRIEYLVESWIPLSDRIIFLKLNTKEVKTNLIQVYAPTSGCSENECGSFYNQLHDTLGFAKSNQRTIILGDFNAKVGKGQEGTTVGKYGLGRRNERGDMFVNFCKEHKMVIMNTMFEHHERRLYTWRSPADSQNHIVRNEIDYILINDRYKNNIVDVKTKPGADVGSDHNLLQAIFRPKFKLLEKSATRIQTDVQELKNKKIRKQFNDNLKDTFKKTLSSTERWEGIKEALKKAAKVVLNEKPTDKKQDWITNEIIGLMSERRKFKNKDVIKYKQVQKIILMKIKEAKETWLTQKCNNIEALENLEDQ
ncbi:craniofacial development protein 2-like [Chrysoperla carnea]|uniref:craniofacial development protein 2-like n=1 Tax=Chrysoperla carnea TaxID=189513 RepID=UPI001D066D59|nr:craniofacial development protein 2-like [Chrysoperla carnea]